MSLSLPTYTIAIWFTEGCLVDELEALADAEYGCQLLTNIRQFWRIPATVGELQWLLLDPTEGAGY